MIVPFQSGRAGRDYKESLGGVTEGYRLFKKERHFYKSVLIDTAQKIAMMLPWEIRLYSV